MKCKLAIRKKYMNKRNLMSVKEINNLSTIISSKIFETDEYKNSDTLFTYIGVKSELKTTEIIKKAWADSKKVAVPVVINNKHEMVFTKINDFNTLYENKFGILEPKIDENNILKSNKKTLIIVPGIAFDFKKNRIGYGGGYYDKYLSENKFMASIGICFDFQIIENIPAEPFDYKVNIIISEKKILR